MGDWFPSPGMIVARAEAEGVGMMMSYERRSLCPTTTPLSDCARRKDVFPSMPSSCFHSWML